MFHEFDSVRLKRELSADTHHSWPGIPTQHLPRGARGTVVMVYHDGDTTAYEVEFVSEDGATEALLTLTQDDLETD
ncbi:DUF4926 domain-containing protein [Nocardia sp. NEAU-G5]|uniref:DUF4926 domain-containing protein n=1 Tax=Nocardia albiluteola TaxID=2842303 RepID=A0ABS6ARP4_9NOCA|nr:DUF4926 domain-containing protein [Nocardia albiluteola]MBU3060682.1 DUF4926 domain-containing protein [Nocardia albiluteola]